VDICFISLGCDKNLVDSEMMVTSLRQSGYNIIYNADEADVIVVNTCCFIGDAKEESINTLLEMAAYKEEGKCRLLVAAGCLAQRYHEEIKRELPEVDMIIGTTAYEELAGTINSALNKAASKEKLPIEKLKRIKKTVRIYAKLCGNANRCNLLFVSGIRMGHRPSLSSKFY